MSKLDKALQRAMHKKETGKSDREQFPATDKMTKAMDKSKNNRYKTEIAVLGVAKKKVQDNEIRPSYTRTEVLIPDGKILESNRIMTHLKDPRVRDYYDIVRTRVFQQTRSKGWNSLMVTSVYPDEGKTLTAINLGLSIARQMQHTALLVGANFRSPKICKYFGFEENRAGLSDYLTQNAQVENLLFNPGIDKMVILPTGKEMIATDDLGSPRMKNLVEELKYKYPDRYVIYDCPHILDMPDTLIFSSYVDAVLIVVKAGQTPGHKIREAVQTLEEQGVNIVGMVLNKAESGMR